MKFTKHYFALLILLSFVSRLNTTCRAEQQNADSPDYIVKNEFIAMQDGIKLATDVYLPPQEGKFPCILARTPYDKGFPKTDKGTRQWFEWLTNNGFAVVGQDCRGRFLSEGEFYAFANERSDGLTTVKWIREQPWSNGKIGGWGGSYVGYTQWAISDVLDVLTPQATGAELYETFYPGGMFSLALAFNWGLFMDSKTMNPIPIEKVLASYTILPLSVADDMTYKNNKFTDDWLRHPSNDGYWKTINHRAIATCPVISIAGWYDIFLISQINDFQALNEKGHPDNRLVITPVCHGPQAFKNEYGGPEKVGVTDDLLKRFMLKHLKGSDVELMQPPFKDNKYNLFIMERNEYFGCDEWPPKAATFTNYYIGPDKYIGLEIPQKQGQMEYTYDPNNPYPNKGGTTLALAVGPALQNENLSRTDQLAFETDTLKSPLVLLGPISATLYVSSDVPGTDFIVCLQDVFPNGNIINIQEGGATVSFEEPCPKEAKLSVWATGYQLNCGHKLRAVITSSWFPRFNRNLNSAEPIFSAKTIKIAHQKIHFGPAHPSSIILPVLSLED